MLLLIDIETTQYCLKLRALLEDGASLVRFDLDDHSARNENFLFIINLLLLTHESDNTNNNNLNLVFCQNSVYKLLFLIRQHCCRDKFVCVNTYNFMTATS